MKQMTRTATALAGLVLIVAGCSAASTSPSASQAASPSATATASPTPEPTLEPTPTPSPTPTPVPTPVAEQHLVLDLSLAYALGTIEGPGTCDIGANGIWIYLEHRKGIVLDAYITVGPAQGGISGGEPVAGGGHFGPEEVRIRVADTTTGGFVDTVDAAAEIAPDLRSGTFSGTWNGEPLTGDYTCS